MTALLLKLLGVHLDHAGNISHPSLAFRGGVSPWWVLLAIVILGALVAWMYYTTARYVSATKRLFMTALRTLFLLFLLGLLLRPVLAFTIEGSIRRTLILLVDTSKSMSLAEKREQPDDLKRVAIARGLLEPDQGLNQALPANVADLNQVPRMELLKASLKNQKLDLLRKLYQDYDIRTFAFPPGEASVRATEGPTAVRVEIQPGGAPTTKPAQAIDGVSQWIDKLQPTGSTTPIGDGLREVIARTRGQSLAGILLMTDGGNNSGSDPITAAQLAMQEPGGVPIYAYGVGTASKDIIVSSLDAAPTVFAKDEVPVFIHVRAQNLRGESAKLKLTLGTEVVATQDVTFAGNDEQVIGMKFTPKLQGEYDLVASIDARADEITATNNATPPQRLKVIEGKIRVLFVDQSPRWEFKYLQQQLQHGKLKGEKAEANSQNGGPPNRVDLKCLLLDADPGAAKPGPNGEESPYIARFPETKDQLINNYDVLIFGDVDPKSLTSEQLDNVVEFVNVFGGGFIMIAGRQHAPADYMGTKIRDMLPVVLESRTVPRLAAGSDVADKPIKLELTRKGRDNPMLRLAADESQNVNKWRQLPPIYWEYRVAAAKSAAEVLLVDPDPAKSSRFGRMPVVALQGYGSGQVLWVGTDNTWRWRRNRGDEFYVTLWSQMIQRLAQTHLLGAAKRTRIELDKEIYTAGDRVIVTAHLFDPLYKPLENVTVSAHSAKTDGPGVSDVLLKRQPDGVYRGEFTAAEAGAFKFYVDAPGDPEQKKTYSVIEPATEVGDTNLNEELLTKLASTTNGSYFREESLYKLPDELNRKTELVRSPQEVDLGSSWLYFVLLMGTVTAEWILRKTAQLK